ncbi:retropepsin-like aspartic protease, partial [Escherichia coli]|uniref:retropepsin-like aspartic protease n=1 Tax=Escherichia coli TaxID=562 RepID=UPI00307A79B9
MPLSIFNRLEIGEIKPTTIALQMADTSVTYPKGIVEDVLVKVRDFIFPADFVVLDMPEDGNTPLILGRPFLATGRALIDVQDGDLTFRVNDEEMKISIYDAMKQPDEKTMEDCRVIEQLSPTHFQSIDPVEFCMQNSIFSPADLDEACDEILEYLESIDEVKALPE